MNERLETESIHAAPGGLCAIHPRRTQHLEARVRQKCEDAARRRTRTNERRLYSIMIDTVVCLTSEEKIRTAYRNGLQRVTGGD